MTQEQAPKPTQWRCLVEGCRIYNQWQTTPAGVRHVGGEHYMDEHYKPAVEPTETQRAAAQYAAHRRYVDARKASA